MNELITAFWPYYLGIFALAVVFGFTAQRSAFCPVGGLREWVNERRATRLATYFGAIAVAVLFSAVAEGFSWFDLSQTTPPYRTTEFAWGRYILGGFIFGFGMVLAAGCGMRNLVRVGQGSLKAIWLVMIMALVAYVMTRTSVYAQWIMPWVNPMSLQLTDSGAQDLASLVVGQTDSLSTWRLILGGIIGSVLLMLLLRLKDFRKLYPIMTALVIGFVIVVLML